MSGIGLLNEATIRIKFDVDESELKSVKSAFAGISKALNLQKAIQDMSALEKVVDRLSTELEEAKNETKRMATEMATQIEAATKKVTSATNRRIKVLTDANNKLKEQVRSEREAAKAATASAVAAERAAVAKRAETAANRAAAAEVKKKTKADLDAAAAAKRYAAEQKKLSQELSAKKQRYGMEAVQQTGSAINAYKQLVLMLTRVTVAQKASAAASQTAAQRLSQEAALQDKVAAALKRRAAAGTLTIAGMRGVASAQALLNGSSATYEAHLRQQASNLQFVERAREAFIASMKKENAERAKNRALMTDQTIRREAAARAELNKRMQESADKAKAVARYEQLIAEVVKQGFGFYAKYGAVIQAVTKARNGDTKALQMYMDKLAAVIKLENSRKTALKTGVFTNAAGEQVRMSLMEQVSARISDAEKRVDALFRASYRLTMVGHTLRRFSQDIFRIGSEIMNTFGEFEFMLNRARGALSVFSGDMIGAYDGATLMRDGVLELSQELKVFPVKDVAQALYFWGSTTGQVVDTVEDLKTTMSGLNPIMKTAAMTNTSYEATIKGVYSILTQFYGGSLERADEVTVQLFESTQKTAAEFTDLIQSFKMVGPVAAQAGASFSDVNATLGQLADLGIRGTMAGRGLRQFFIQMVRPSGPAQKALDKRFNELSMSTADPFQGKTFFEATFPEGEFVGIQEHMRNLAIATEELNEADRNRLLAQISTANMLPLITALVTEQRLEIHKLAGANKDYASDSEQAAMFFEKNWKLLDESWNALRGTIDRTVESIRVNIGAVISEALRPFIENIQQVLDKFNDFIKQNPALVAAIGKLVALLGAGAGLAGAILVVLGALTGLGAAIALVADAFSPWFKMVFSVTGALGFLFVALVDNFEYIRATAVKVIDNLTASFSGMEDGISGIGELFEQITAPAREMMNLFVRIASDVVLRISEMIRAFSELEFAGDLINGLIAILGVLVSGRIIGGILLVGKAITAFVASLVVSKILAATTALSAFIKVAAVHGVGNGLKVLGLGISSLVGGPLGFAGLAVAAGFLTYELFPPFKDAVDSLTASFANMEENLKKTVDSMGDAGVILTQTLVRWQLQAVDAAQVREEKTKVDAEISRLQEDAKAFAEDTAKRLADAGRESIEDARLRYQEGAPLADEKTINAYLDTFRAPELAVIETKLRALYLEQETLAGRLAQFSEDRAGNIDKNLNIIKSQYASFVKSAIDMGLEIDTSDQNFYMAVEKLLSSGVAPDIAGLIAGRILLLPEKLTPVEIEKIVKADAAWKQLGGLGGTLASLPQKLLRDILGSGRVGSESSQVTSELERFVDKQFSVVDPAELRRILLTPLTEFGFDIKESLSGIAKNPAYEGVAEAIGLLFQKQMEMGDEIPLNLIETGLKEVLDSMIHDATASVTPIFSEVTRELQTLSIWGPQNYEAMAQAILDAVMPDGKTLLEAFGEGELPLGQAGLNYQEVAKNLVDEGYGGEELARIVALTAESTGEDVGEAANEGLRKGIAETLGAERLSVSDLVDMRKMGDTASQIKKAIAWLGGKVANMAMSGNIQMRGAGREEGFSIVQMMVDNLITSEGRKREVRVERNTLNQLGKLLPNMPKIFRDLIREQFIGLAEEGILTPEQVLKLFPKVRIDPKDVPKPDVPKPAELADMLSGGIKPVVARTGGADAAFEIGVGVANRLVDGVKKTVANEASIASTGTSLAALITNASGAGVVRVANEFGGRVVGLGWVDELGVAMINEVIRTAGSMRGNIISASVKAVDTAKYAGNALGGVWAVNFGAGVGRRIGTMSSKMALTVRSASSLAALQDLGGDKVGNSWVADVVAALDKGQSAIDKAASGSASAMGPTDSPPKRGPLHHIDDWGYKTGAAWGKGYSKGAVVEARKASRAVRNTLREGGGLGNSTFISNNKKEITIKIDVSSKDGSVDRAKASQIRRGVMDALTLAGLEHMVTVQ